jgi:hypothetical protein
MAQRRPPSYVGRDVDRSRPYPETSVVMAHSLGDRAVAGHADVGRRLHPRAEESGVPDVAGRRGRSIRRVRLLQHDAEDVHALHAPRVPACDTIRPSRQVHRGTAARHHLPLLVRPPGQDDLRRLRSRARKSVLLRGQIVPHRRIHGSLSKPSGAVEVRDHVFLLSEGARVLSRRAVNAPWNGDRRRRASAVTTAVVTPCTASPSSRPSGGWSSPS